MATIVLVDCDNCGEEDLELLGEEVFVSRREAETYSVSYHCPECDCESRADTTRETVVLLVEVGAGLDANVFASPLAEEDILQAQQELASDEELLVPAEFLHLL